MPPTSSDEQWLANIYWPSAWWGSSAAGRRARAQHQDEKRFWKMCSFGEAGAGRGPALAPVERWDWFVCLWAHAWNENTHTHTHTHTHTLARARATKGLEKDLRCELASAAALLGMELSKLLHISPRLLIRMLQGLAYRAFSLGFDLLFLSVFGQTSGQTAYQSHIEATKLRQGLQSNPCKQSFGLFSAPVVHTEGLRIESSAFLLCF